MWKAQGYFTNTDGESREEMGNDYFEKLKERSFFQPSSNNKYLIHDLMLELAKFVSRNECYVMEDQSANPPTTLRHLTINIDISPSVFEMICRYKMLRTLLVFGNWEDGNALDEILKELKSLRVIDLSYAFSQGLNLPNSIGELSHLRYLDMGGNSKISLPNSFGYLLHLQVLNINGCEVSVQNDNYFRYLFHLQVLNIKGCVIQKLRNVVPNMISLRYLYANEDFMHKICLSKLTNLQELPRFDASKQNMADLENLNQLRGSLSIVGIPNVEAEARKANIKEKKYLSHLSLTGQNSINKKVLEALQPHPDIKELEIRYYDDSTLPRCMLDIQVLSKLQIVSMRHCYRLESLPPFGQLRFLRCLILDGLGSIKKIDEEFYGNNGEKIFPSLEELRLLNFRYLMQWKECFTAPCFTALKRLQIKNCADLESDLSLLHHANLEMVALLGCPKLLASTSTLNGTNSWPGWSSITYLTTDDTMLRNDGSVIISSLPSLQTLNIENIGISHFSEEQESWFKQLTSLKDLQFRSCDNLLSLPESLENLSLGKLTISKCNSILSLPENGLPATLKVLCIYCCFELEKRCENEEGADWQKVEHIPTRYFQAISGVDDDLDWDSSDTTRMH